MDYMEYTKEDWVKNDEGQFWQILCPHPSGHGRQNLGFFRKEDLTPIANLIVAIPDMYQALKAQHDAIDILFAMLIERDQTFFPSKSGKPWEAIEQGNKALAKAQGRI